MHLYIDMQCPLNHLFSMSPCPHGLGSDKGSGQYMYSLALIEHMATQSTGWACLIYHRGLFYSDQKYLVCPKFCHVPILH